MKILMLNGHGINMRIDSASLFIKDGRFSTEEEPQKYVFLPKKIPYDTIVIYGRSGNLSLESIRWLNKHNVAIIILDWNGKLLSSILPPESVQVKTKFSQYNAYLDKTKRLKIAKKFIRAKFEKTSLMLNWLNERYGNVKTDFSKEESNLEKVNSIKDILLVEARVAGFYWQEIVKVIPDKLNFETRNSNKNRSMGASDMTNCLLNYGYSILEAECLRALNTVGLDSHIGFLHEMNSGKNSLAYDLQEPFRFLIDLAVINVVESNIMEKKDFIRTENYTLRLRPTGAKKLLHAINNVLSMKIDMYNKSYTWKYGILVKARELAFYLVGKNKTLDFSKPTIKLKREDTEEMRAIILRIPYYEWMKMGFSKGTLHYLKQNARNDKPFTLNQHVKERIMELYG